MRTMRWGMGLLGWMAVALTAHAQSTVPWTGALARTASAPVVSRLHVVAVGDVLLHEPLHRQALREPEGHRSLWSTIEPLWQSADVAYANLEGPAAPGVYPGGRVGKDPGPLYDRGVYGSYPLFNYHASLLSDLKASGVDVVSTANNHALDRGSVGLDRTLEGLDAVGLPHMGSRASTAGPVTAATDWAVVTEQAGWRIAWLACSFGTNGIPDRAHQVLNCYTDKAVLLEAVHTLAHTPGIDAVIVTPHVGIEYEDRPRPEVVALDRAFIDAGALAVLGAHPHVTQPWVLRHAPDGHEGLIVYSLGNFVSGQFQRVPTRSSVMVGLGLARTTEGQVFIESVGHVPLEMVHRPGRYAVIPIDASTGTPAMLARDAQMFGTLPEESASAPQR